MPRQLQMLPEVSSTLSPHPAWLHRSVDLAAIVWGCYDSLWGLKVKGQLEKGRKHLAIFSPGKVATRWDREGLVPPRGLQGQT